MHRTHPRTRLPHLAGWPYQQTLFGSRPHLETRISDFTYVYERQYSSRLSRQVQNTVAVGQRIAIPAIPLRLAASESSSNPSWRYHIVYKKFATPYAFFSSLSRKIPSLRTLRLSWPEGTARSESMLRAA